MKPSPFGTEGTSTRLSPAESAIREELTRVVTSSVFAHSDRMQRFITYIVNETIAGRERTLKEYAIGSNVYDKPASFDPRVDSIVRVEASRLRRKLQQYYLNEGRLNKLSIMMPASGYIPEFRSAAEPAVMQEPSIGAQGDVECLYLKGRHFLKQRTPKALATAIQAFTAAAKDQEGFSLAMGCLADCYTALAWLEFNAPESLWTKVSFCSERALREHPGAAVALTSAACERAAHSWQWEAAEQDFLRAIQLEPEYAGAYEWYAALCLAPQGRLDEALFYLQRARRLDGHSAITTCHIGRILYLMRRYADAAQELKRSIQLNPRLFPAHCDLGFVYARLGHWPQAADAFSAARNIAEEPPALSGLGYVTALSGAREAAEAIRADLTRLAENRYVSPVSLAQVDIGLEDFDSAFEHLAVALARRAARIVQVPVDPAFDGIKTDPRFVQLFSALGI